MGNNETSASVHVDMNWSAVLNAFQELENMVNELAESSGATLGEIASNPPAPRRGNRISEVNADTMDDYLAVAEQTQNKLRKVCTEVAALRKQTGKS